MRGKTLTTMTSTCKVLAYTVVDYTQLNAQDFNNPNTDKSIAIVDKSPKYTVEETSVFIEEKVPPQMIAKDQQIEVLNLIEAGEIVSVELVIDNPYIAFTSRWTTSSTKRLTE